jgi:hypothetical protein
MGTRVTTPDNGELKQLVVGLATQFYYAVRNVRGGQDPDGPELADRFMSLVPAITATGPVEWSGNVPQTPEEFEAVLTECVQKATQQTGLRAYSALVHMINVFNDLASYAEQACADVNIPEFLRQAGIRAASDE